jgi:hypothetical protein
MQPLPYSPARSTRAGSSAECRFARKEVRRREPQCGHVSVVAAMAEHDVGADGRQERAAPSFTAAVIVADASLAGFRAQLVLQNFDSVILRPRLALVRLTVWGSAV